MTRRAAVRADASRPAPLVLALLAAVLPCAAAPATRAAPPAEAADRRESLERPGWKLVWHDEFDGKELDRTRWNVDQGGLWSNAELQFYTDRPENLRVEDGKLVLEARREEYFGNEFTSARINTRGKLSFTYGRVEARMKVPPGQGLWPAFWMLGSAFGELGWPGCGEIDVVEVVGKEPASVHATVHGASFHGAGGLHKAYTLPVGSLSDAAHVYAVEWEPGEIRWYLDDVQYQTITPKDLPIPDHWPFDRPFFLILNLAVGGTWPGEPDGTTPFPARLLVDDVRVYQRG